MTSDINIARSATLPATHAPISFTPATRTAPTAGFQFVPLNTIRPEPVRWLWPGRIAYGKLALLIGDPGVGKSHITIDVAARVTSGNPLPGGNAMAPGRVLLLSAEDGAADTIRPRFDAAGGDPSRIEVEQSNTPRSPDLLQDLASVRARILTTQATLVIVDPIEAYMPEKVNSWNNASVRRVLRPLKQLAEETGVAVVTVMHLNKNSDAPALYRAGGSIGYLAAARVALLVAPDQDVAGLMVLAGLKSNLGPLPESLQFEVVGVAGGGTSHIEWRGTSDRTAAALLAAQSKEGDRHRKTEDAEDYLREALAAGPCLKEEVLRQAAEWGHKRRTIERAAGNIGVQLDRNFGSAGRWSLPL